MDDDIEAELQRPLYPWTGKRIVRYRDEIVLARNLRNGRQIDELEQRIARGFHPQHFCLGSDRRAQSRRVGHVDEACAQARRALAHVLEKPIGAAVKIVACHDVRAGIECIEQRRHARQA